jgi:uncharacterized protein (TIGR02646 family)
MRDLFDALLFPINHQERSPDPGPFKEHRSYKPHLQREFRRKCVYCRTPDGLKGAEGFGVDHYQPRFKFPHLSLEWSNLFYACNVCNTWKGESVSTAELFLPNPCEHRMSEHLQYREADVETYTPYGEWLAELVHLGERRELREFILSALGEFLTTRNELIGDLIAYEARFDDAQDGEESILLRAAIREAAEELARVDRHIERLIGEAVGRR